MSHFCDEPPGLLERLDSRYWGVLILLETLLPNLTYDLPIFKLLIITHVCRLYIYSGSIWYHINTLSQARFDPPKQREDCYQSTTLPPSHHGWISFSDSYCNYFDETFFSISAPKSKTTNRGSSRISDLHFQTETMTKHILILSCSVRTLRSLKENQRLKRRILWLSKYAHCAKNKQIS